MKKFIFIIAASVFISACANTDSRIISVTAYELGVSPSDVALTSTNKGLMDTMWSVTTTEGKKYKCRADDMLRDATCRLINE